MKPAPAFFDLDSDKKWLAEFERKLDQVDERKRRLPARPRGATPASKAAR